MSTPNIEAIYPLSPLQEGLLFHTLYAPETGVYFEQLRCTLVGDLDVPAFKQAWRRVVARHAVLRTFFVWDRGDQALQAVRNHVEVPWTQLDWSDLPAGEREERLNRYLEADLQQGFVLTDAPLLRLALIRAGAQTHYFVFSYHHLLLDGWSLSIVLNEVFSLYEAIRRDEVPKLAPPSPYRAYIGWLQQRRCDEAETFWRNTLATFSSPTRLNARGPHSTSTAVYQEETFSLSADVTNALTTLARTHQLTLNTVIQGAWAVLLRRYSGNEDVVFGTVVAGRPADLEGVERMVGLFINTVPVRASVSDRALVIDWLQGLQQRLIAIREHQYVSLIDLREWSGVPADEPLFESVVVFENYPLSLSETGSIAVRDATVAERTNYPLTLVAVPDDALWFRLSFDSSRYDAGTIRRLLGHLQTLLSAMVEDMRQPLGHLPLLTADERRQLLGTWNDTHVELASEGCIHELFEAQVARTPDADALVFREQRLTYRELNRRANQLARYLRAHGVERETFVAICMERSLDMVVAIMGVLKAGGAYVPLDPGHPQQRLVFMMEDMQPVVLLTQERLRDSLPAWGGSTVWLDADWPAIARECPENLASVATPASLAYAIYTSGSTGRPKGVLIEHRAPINLLTALERAVYADGPQRRLRATLNAPISFDASVQQLMLLLRGHTLHIIPSSVRQDGAAFLDYLRRHRVDAVDCTPSHLKMLLRAGLLTDGGGTPALFLVAGEAIDAQMWAELAHASDARFYNIYGPTECTVDATAHYISPDSAEPTIGRPLANYQTYVLDDALRPVPAGVAGELYLGGMGLARGYLNRPRRTAETFIPHPFAQQAGQRLYRTGDLVRYRAGGNLEFLGRVDHQVKLRGVRIELGEIEATLKRHASIRDAVALVREDRPDDKRLVAYAVPADGTPTVAEIRRYLQERLPRQMVPSAYVFRDELPLTASGKVDRQSLPAPADTEPGIPSDGSTPPRTHLEEMLAGLWADLLGVERVGTHDNFFELGGHSLLVTRLVSRLRRTLQMDLSLRWVFEYPAMGDLAEVLETALREKDGTAVPPIRPAPRDDTLPLTFAQERVWFMQQLDFENPAYNGAGVFQLQGALDIDALERSLKRIIQRHEILRTRFRAVDGRPEQVIEPAVSWSLPTMDICHRSPDEQDAEIRRQVRAYAQTPFDLTRPPLLHAALLRLGDTQYALLLVVHHIIFDGWSTGVFLRELMTLYDAFSAGEPSPLAELPIQYADYAVWQRVWLQGDMLAAHLDYWTQQLAGAPDSFELPTDRPRPEVSTYRGAVTTFVLSRDLLDDARTLSRRTSVTLFVVLLAAFQTLLYRLTGRTDVVVGSDVANRTRHETEALIGLFVNQVVLRSDLAGNPTFRRLLCRVHEIALGAYLHQEFPFDKVVQTLQPERRPNRNPLFQIMFTMQNHVVPPLELADVTARRLEIDATEAAKFDLALFVTAGEDGLVATWNYSTDLFEDATIARLNRQYEMVLRHAVAQPDTCLDNLRMLTETETRQTVMSKQKRKQAKFEKLMKMKPKTVDVAQKLVRTDYLDADERQPLLVRPNVEDVDLIAWGQNNRDVVEEWLHEYGGVLFRGFGIDSVAGFERFAEAVCPTLFGDYGDLPREEVGGKVYSSTPYPSDKAILFHNESSHLHHWPMKQFFLCAQPAQEGGETPIVDCRKIYDRLDPEIRATLAEKGLMYVRNFVPGLDVDWQEFFQTDDRSEVEAYCRDADIAFEWRDDGGLRTRKVRQAVAVHPETGETVFFNQLQLHHVSCLDAETRASLSSMFGEDDFPRNVYYGDGAPIPDAVVAKICDVYAETAVSFPWQRGDILALDNMLMAHSRNPYVGPRKIVVALGEMIREANVVTQV